MPKVSDSSQKMRKILDVAIQEHEIIRDDYDRFLTIASADGHFDTQKRVLLANLNDLMTEQSKLFQKGEEQSNGRRLLATDTIGIGNAT